MKRRITISADVPAEVNDDDLAAYLTEAIEGWSGQYSPEDPLFDGVNVNSISIRHTIYRK